MEVDCTSLEAFLAALKARSLARAVVAWRDEYGPVGEAGGTADYRRVRETVVLAYHAGAIIRCRLEDAEADRAAIVRLLTEAGVAAEERCRNLTGDGGSTRG